MDNLSPDSFHTNLNKFITISNIIPCHDVNSLLCSLQIIGHTSDQFGLDPNNPLIQKFYVNLYELISNTKEESDLIWAAVDVLQSIMTQYNVKQGFFYNSKPNKSKFTLILIKLLKDQLSLDRKIKILQLLQELTYETKLQWQEGHLSELVMLLVKWISNEEKKLLSFSLGVLVNVCTNNKFVLKRTLSKRLMRLLLNPQSVDLFTKIQVYKLLLALEEVCGQLPHIDVNNLIDCTFIVLEEGLKDNNLFVIRHAVDFFMDISEHLLWKKSVLEYSHYKNKIVSTIEAINISKSITHSHNTSQCIEVVLKFVDNVVLLNTEDFVVLYPIIIDNVMNWAQSLGIFQQTMSILQTIIVKVRDYNNYMDHDLQCDIYNKLEESLNVLLMFLKEPSDVENNSSTWKFDRYAPCLRVLQEILKLRKLNEKVEELCQSILQSTFYSLLLVDINNLDNLQSIKCAYIEALCLLSDLVAKNPLWMSLYSEVLNKKQVYNVLAYVIYNGSKHTKGKALYLITKFSQQNILMLTNSLEEFEFLSLSKVKNSSCNNSTEIEEKSLNSSVQDEQLQICIDKFEEMINSNEINNIKTYDVYKLYEYNNDAMKKKEIYLKKSLDNASVEIARLNDQINNNFLKLNELLLDKHYENETLMMANDQLQKNLYNNTKQLLESENNFTQLSRNYESKSKIIVEQDSSINNLKNQLEELNIASNQMKSELLDQIQNEKNENEINVSKLEQKIIEKENIIREKIEEIDSKTSSIRILENELTEKNKENDELRKDLEEQHRIRAIISQMLSDTRPNKPQ